VKVRVLPLVCLLLAFWPSSLTALVLPELHFYTWDSGDNSTLWERPANWVGDVTPPSSPNTGVAFGTGAQTLVNVVETRVLSQMRFDANAQSFTLKSGTLEFASPGGGDFPLLQQLSSNGQWIQSEVSLKTGLIVITSGAGALQLSGNLQGSGPLVKEGSGGDLVLAGNNFAFNGNIEINTGTVRAASSSALGDATGKTRVAPGATLSVGSQTPGANLIISEPISVAGNGVGGNGAINNLHLSNTLSGRLTLEDHARVQSSSGVLTLSGGVSGDGKTLTVGGAGNVVVNGAIATGSGGLVKEGTGTLTLAAPNSFQGPTTLLGGTILLQAMQVFSDTSAITVSQTSILDLNGFSETVGSLLGAGTVDFDGAVLTLASGTSSFGGQFTGAGTLLIKEGASLSLDAAFNAPNLNIILDGGTLLLGSGQQHQFGNLLISGNSVLDFGNSGSTSVLFSTVGAEAGNVLTVENWTHALDYFFVQNNPGAQGTAPTNQVDFTGTPIDTWTGDDTRWLAYANTTYGQLTPVPEPSTYGALLLSACAGFVVYRRRRAAKRSAA
jgi:fibronectin-binding autotransporter adhesin